MPDPESQGAEGARDGKQYSAQHSPVASSEDDYCHTVCQTCFWHARLYAEIRYLPIQWEEVTLTKARTNCIWSVGD